MKRICKQCGKEFTLTPSELNFYRSKNLAFPKRCQGCRAENKSQKQTDAEELQAVEPEAAEPEVAESEVAESEVKRGAEEVQVSPEAEEPQAVPGAVEPQAEREVNVKSADVQQTGEAGMTEAEEIAKTAEEAKPPIEQKIKEEAAQQTGETASEPESTIQVKQPINRVNIVEEEPVSQARPEVYKPQRERPEIGKKWWIAVVAVLALAVVINFPNFTKKSGSAGVFETKGYTESTTDESISSSESTNDNKATDSSSAGDKQNVSVKVRFRNNTLLQQHYDKHGKGMGFASAVEYELAAAAVVSNTKALHKTEAEDGDDVYYIKDTNEFVVVSKDGYIRTYFKPSDGINYYNRQ